MFSVDHTRVMLRDGDQDLVGSDYINANMITVSIVLSIYNVNKAIHALYSRMNRLAIHIGLVAIKTDFITKKQQRFSRPSGPMVINFSCSTQLSTKFIVLINVKMPTIVGILTFISMINTTYQ